MRKLIISFVLTLTCCSSLYAQDLSASPSPTPRSATANPTPVQNNARSPLSNTQVQQLAAELEFQRARADTAEAHTVEWKHQADEWKGLYQQEKERAELLRGAGVDRKEAGEQQSLAIQIYQKQSEKDGKRIDKLETDLTACQKSKLKIGGVGALFGFILRSVAGF